VFGIPVLRAQLLCMSAALVFAHAYEAPLYVFAYTTLHLSPGLLGAMLASQGLGALLGSVVGSRIIARIGVGRTVAIGNGTAIALIALLPLAVYVPPAALMFPVFIIGSGLGTAGDIAQVTLRQALSPARLQGRMSAVFRTFFWGAWPIGNLLGGLLAAQIGASTTLWTTALLGGLAFLTIRFTPLWQVRRFPAASPAGLEPPLQAGSVRVP
jgi:predicted MFS family arabinose efflux permease